MYNNTSKFCAVNNSMKAYCYLLIAILLRCILRRISVLIMQNIIYIIFEWWKITLYSFITL